MEKSGGDIELDAVIEFLKSNGLSESESALMEDLMEKNQNSPQLGSSVLERFYFPMPPPVRVPATMRLKTEDDGEVRGGGSSFSSSDDDGDEFVSLGSSTTDLCSSEFTNPYGIRTTRPTSQASSDRMSQFGTARDYPDFEMQNDLFWYGERDENDFYSMPSEDKYITTVPSAKALITSSENEKDLKSSKDCHESESLGDHYSCSAPLCACCSSEGRLYKGIPTEYDLGNSNFEVENNRTNENNNYDFAYDEIVFEEPFKLEGEANEGNESDSTELKIHEEEADDYETFELRIIHRKNRTGFEESKEFPIVPNSIISGRYYVTELLGSGAFSKVVHAHDLYMGTDVCLKIIKNDKDFFDQSLDEIKLLKFVNKHDPADERHIMRLYDYFYHQEHLFIVTELLRANLYEFQKFNQESNAEPYFTMQRLQIITRQILEALVYLHGLGIIHCDLKPENILIKSYRRCEIKIIDLGSSCFENDSLSQYIQSRSYRAPEVILGLGYDKKIDIWSIGCILAELYSGEVLFPNEPVVMLLARMVGILGPIDLEMLMNGQDANKYFTKEYDLYYIDEDTNRVEYIVPEMSSLKRRLKVSDSRFIDFLRCLLEINPKRRPTAKEALQHHWFSCSY